MTAGSALHHSNVLHINRNRGHAEYRTTNGDTIIGDYLLSRDAVRRWTDEGYWGLQLSTQGNSRRGMDACNDLSAHGSCVIVRGNIEANKTDIDVVETIDVTVIGVSCKSQLTKLRMD